MQVTIHAIGRMKKGPEQELLHRYLDRFDKSGASLGLQHQPLRELPESRAADTEARKADEAERLLHAIKPTDILIAMDERGKTLTSPDFASKIGQWRDDGISHLHFIIGGPDGLSKEVRHRADFTLCFGAATWPHQIARIMLAEQIYRAASILAGHPYHRV